MIKFEKKGAIGIITIDRPEAKNAVNAEVASGIESAIDALEADGELWVGIIASSGDVFCAGADLKAISSGQAGGLQTERGGFAGFVQRERTKPVIAAVDGPALAGGCEIVLAADLVVASEISRFGIPEVKRSLVAAAGGLFRLPRAIPRNVEMEAALTGDPISAERAFHFGLVNELVPAGQALSAAIALAERI
ncbi:MAG: enoyl-CoA hydratase/isomerase family protein, partial [Actinobacteria bacterium]|nr:enoyl-CoA hydratase/isomerase family protein [Actinomycetota bacterium]